MLTCEVVSGDQDLSCLQIHHAKEGVIEGHEPALPCCCGGPAGDCATPRKLHLQRAAVQHLLLPQLLPANAHAACKKPKQVMVLSQVCIK